MSKIYLAEKQQLDAQNQILSQINTKINGVSLADVDTFILDFQNDPITILSGGYDELHRLITT